jgi:hypothetical protein
LTDATKHLSFKDKKLSKWDRQDLDLIKLFLNLHSILYKIANMTLKTNEPFVYHLRVRLGLPDRVEYPRCCIKVSCNLNCEYKANV